MIWKVEGFKYKRMGTKCLPFGYLEFLTHFGGNHAHTCMHRRLPRPGPAPVPMRECGFGPDSFWNGLHLVLLESGATENRNWVMRMRTRNPTVPGTRPLLEVSGTPTFWTDITVQTRAVLNSFICQNSCDGSVCTVATVPSNDNLYSAPLDHFQNRTETQKKYLNMFVLKIEILLPLPFFYSE